MTKIFQIGFNRCATGALYQFFLRNGIWATHWWGGGPSKTIRLNSICHRPLLTGLEKYQAFTDMEHPDEIEGIYYVHMKHYQELDKQYPGSKFILNFRNQDDWIRSRNNLKDPQGVTIYKNSCMEILNLTEEELNNKWRKDWDKHIHEVQDYFKDRPGDLLMFNIDEPNGGERLVEFLKPEFEFDAKHWTVIKH